MNSASAEMSASNWSRKKILWLILFAFGAHLAFIFLLGARKTAAPRPIINVPVLHLADNSDELIRLTDPTLFALPHAEDFTAAIWTKPFPVEPPSFRYTEPPPFLPPTAARLGAAFKTFMQTNRFAQRQIAFKPEPQLVIPTTPIVSVLPQKSTWQLGGELARRKIVHAISAPTLTLNDVLSPSRVQLLVDSSGNVISAVMLETSGDITADNTALTLARALQFAPSNKIQFGEINFHWHTVPVATP
jgi:hypothetical protein